MTLASSQTKRRYPFNLLILVTLLGVLLMLWYVSDYLGEQQTGAVTWHASIPCTLPEASCRTPLPQERQLLFQLDTQNPTPLDPLPVTVQLRGFSATELNQLSLELDLQGRDMYMGYNRTPLEHQGEGVFTAAPTLGLCTDEIMVWRASVLIHPEEGDSYGSYYDFTVSQKDFL